MCPHPLSRLSKIVAMLLVTAITVASSANLWAQPVRPTLAQEAAAIRAILKQASQSYQQREFAESVRHISSAQKRFSQLSERSNITPQQRQQLLAPLYRSLQKAHALLELEGMKLPPLGKPKSAPAPTTKLSPPPTKRNTLSFANDIAPVLAQQCVGCHGAETQRRELNVETYAQLLLGGENGPVIETSQPAQSLLLRKLLGTADGQQMPLNRPALPPDTIARIEKWIVAGAKFDASLASTMQSVSVKQLTNLAKAESATPEELSAEREKIAREHWRLSLPDSQFDTAKTDSFFLIGNIGQEELRHVGTLAEKQLPRISNLIGVRPEQKLFKGRLTVFVFRENYGYTEFGLMVEKRKLPVAQLGHWSNSKFDQYIAVVDQQSSARWTGVLAEQLVGAHVAALGTPYWYTKGIARTSAQKIAPADTRFREKRQRVAEVVSWLKDSDEFFKNKLPAEQADVISFAFVVSLMQQKREFRRLANSLYQGVDFEEAFLASFRKTPQDTFVAWVRSGAAAQRRR